MQEGHKCNPRIKNMGSFRSKGADCERVAWAGATGQGPRDAGGSLEGLAGKQCLHNSPASSCACKDGKLPNAKKGHEPNKACGISRRQPEGRNDSKETNHSAPACAAHHLILIHSPCENAWKLFG